MSTPPNNNHATTTAAFKRLEQIKSQLNLSPSTMSLQAPKDMEKERAAASFNIEALQHFWIGGKDKYLNRVSSLCRYC